MIAILEMTEKDKQSILNTLKDADFSEDEALEIIHILEEYEEDDNKEVVV